MKQPPKYNEKILTNEQWESIKDHLPSRKGKRGPMVDNRLFVEALLWLARYGARWADIPPNYGLFNSIKRRFYRWVERGVLSDLFTKVTSDADREWLCLDATIARTHQQAAGAPRKKGGLQGRPLDDLVEV